MCVPNEVSFSSGSPAAEIPHEYGDRADSHPMGMGLELIPVRQVAAVSEDHRAADRVQQPHHQPVGFFTPVQADPRFGRLHPRPRKIVAPRASRPKAFTSAMLDMARCTVVVTFVSISFARVVRT